MPLRVIALALLTFAPAAALAQDVVINKNAAEAQANPTVRIAQFEGAKAHRDILKNAIHYSDWFTLSDEALYQISAKFATEGGKHKMELVLRDNIGNGVKGFRQEIASSVPAKQLIFAAVDRLISEVFNNPGFCSSKLAYVKAHSGIKEIWVGDFYGAAPKRISFTENIATEPAFSPDGRFLAYTRYSGFSTDIVLTDLGLQRARSLSHHKGLNSAVSFSNSGSHVALALSQDRNVEVYVKAVADGTLTRVTSDKSIDTSPVWSPDDKTLCFVSDRYAGKPTLYLSSARGGKAKRLLRTAEEAVSPSWSPVSNKICFSYRTGGKYTIAMIDMNSAGRDPIVLVKATGDWESPSWAADGRHIVCSSNHSGKLALYLVDSRYGRIIPLKNYQGDDTFPAYSGTQ
ncbi:MAG: TolB protein [Rhodothermales bacterium]|jgi:TolB protein